MFDFWFFVTYRDTPEDILLTEASKAKVVRIPVLNLVCSEFYYVEHFYFKAEHS